MRFSLLVSLITLASTVAFGLQEPLPRPTHVGSRSVQTPLHVLQIHAPPRDSYDGAACSQVVVQNDFTASYGKPYIGTYAPPANCTFTTAFFNMTVTSRGINYDRLSLLYFGDTELWRSTTAMPVRTGIYYTFSKDMTAYMPLLRTQQKVIMQLDNLYDSVFTGNFNVTITALYYDDDASNGTINPPDAVLPISSRSSAQDKTSVFSLPDANASVALTFPRNAERAVVSVFASGNGNEEFWYTDVPAQFTETFGNSSFANGYGPFREVQVLIDGELAGMVWPAPIVFTGGINTGLWSPIVGIDAFDLGSVDVDVSPWLGTLCDGDSHVFELKVVGYDWSTNTFGTVASNWYASAAVFLWLDDGGTQTTGEVVNTEYFPGDFLLRPTLTKLENGTNSSLVADILVTNRGLNHTSTITTSKGPRRLYWQQNLLYHNEHKVEASGHNDTLHLDTRPQQSSSPAWEPSSSGVDWCFDNRNVLDFVQAYMPPSDYTILNSTLYARIANDRYDYGRAALHRLIYPDPDHDCNSTEVVWNQQQGFCFFAWNDTYYEDAGAIDPAIGSFGQTNQTYTRKQFFLPTPEGRVYKDYEVWAAARDGYEPALDYLEIKDTLSKI